MAHQLLCSEDIRLAARRRIPRLVFDFIDGAAGDERLAALNRNAFDRLRLLPRVLVNVERCQCARTFLGHRWNLPFGIAPMGMCNLAWPGADRLLGAAARRYNIPLCVSTAASSTLETMRELAGESAWFQLYLGQSEEAAMALVQRAHLAGYRHLLLTVDVPRVAPRRRDLRNGFQAPLRIGLRQLVDFTRHPRWSLATLHQGVPRTANYARDGELRFVRGESRGRTDYEFLQRLRDAWPGSLVVKGVLAPADAVACRDAGAEAVYVSNHGGRQFDSAPPALSMLPRLRAALGEDYPLLVDSGVRSGEDIVKALALGADLVMLGRPFLFAVAAGGRAGLDRQIELLRDEVSLTLAQLGRPDIDALESSLLIDDRGQPLAAPGPEVRQ